MTRQREAVMQAVLDSPRHMTADEIFEEARLRMPGISRATVYRNLGLMERDGQVRRVRLADYLEREKGFAHRCVPIGMSCGGLHAIRFAAVAPDRVSVLYLDAPVVNLLSCPLHYGDGERDEAMAQECLCALGKTESEMLSYREHPLDYIPVLIQNRIPVVMVYGDSDPVVPYHENGALLEAAYRAAGVPICTFGKAGCAHHPHGLEDPTPVVEYILQYDC